MAAGFGQLTSTMMMLLNILKIPPGVTVRKEGNGKGTGLSESIASHDFINTIVDITADDVCVGNSPVYIDGLDQLSNPLLIDKFKIIERELNKIARWAAIDLLKYGVSVYKFKKLKKGKEGTLIPVLDDLSFYMMEDGTIKAFGKDNKEYLNALIFFSYSKETMQKVDSKDSRSVPAGAVLSVSPQPIQLNHIESVAKDLFTVERSMYYYRNQLSRIVRFANVDVGVSQQDRVQEVVDTISSAINANSMSLPQTNNDVGYDDEIPVVPNRRGIGKPEMYESIPDFDINKMVDLDYTLGRLFLTMRFPKSYSDFSTALNETAVSMLRGDIRYYKMCNKCRTLMEDTMNNWVRESYRGKDKAHIKLATIPNSEDDDLIQTMNQVVEYIERVYEFVISDSDDKDQARGKLDSLKILLGGSAGFKYVQQWYDRMGEIIEEKFSSDEVTEVQEKQDIEEEKVSEEELDAFEAPPVIEPEQTE